MSGNLAKWVSKRQPQRPGDGTGKGDAGIACDRRRRRESGRRFDALLVNKEGPMALGGVVATEQGINDPVCICTPLQYDGKYIQ